MKYYEPTPENVSIDPDFDSPSFAYLTPGIYAIVLKQIDNIWYLVDASAAIDSITHTAAQGEGWVNAGKNSLSIYGPCEGIPDG